MGDLRMSIELMVDRDKLWEETRGFEIKDEAVYYGNVLELKYLILYPNT